MPSSRRATRPSRRPRDGQLVGERVASGRENVAEARPGETRADELPPAEQPRAGDLPEGEPDPMVGADERGAGGARPRPRSPCLLPHVTMPSVSSYRSKDRAPCSFMTTSLGDARRRQPREVDGDRDARLGGAVPGRTTCVTTIAPHDSPCSYVVTHPKARRTAADVAPRGGAARGRGGAARRARPWRRRAPATRTSAPGRRRRARPAPAARLREPLDHGHVVRCRHSQANRHARHATSLRPGNTVRAPTLQDGHAEAHALLRQVPRRRRRAPLPSSAATSDSRELRPAPHRARA